MAASIDQVKQQIDNVARSTGFRCMPVSWEDASRSTVNGVPSSFGPNISDVRLWEKTGKLLYTVRSENWNERLGYVASKHVAIVVGNHDGSELKNVTLENYLSNASQYGGYTGLTTPSLGENKQDSIFSIRFQTVFLPIESSTDPDKAPENAGRVNFCPEIYNYQTRDEENPRNMLLLCTAQGTSMQQDGVGAKKVLHHEVDPDGKIHRYWLEAESSRHKVGGEQTETNEEASAAAARGKSNAVFIGPKHVGTRFNIIMTVQVPLAQAIVQKKVQKKVAMEWEKVPSAVEWHNRALSLSSPTDTVEVDGTYYSKQQCWIKMIEAINDEGGEAPQAAWKGVANNYPANLRRVLIHGREHTKMQCSARAADAPDAGIPSTDSIKHGISTAARVSRGIEEDVHEGIVKKNPTRDLMQHGTITITIYNTVANGIPSNDDILAAIHDLNLLYAGCSSDKRLVDCTEVTSKNAYTPPYKPPAQAAMSTSDGFPE
jgi:hypothetical protein